MLPALYTAACLLWLPQPAPHVRLIPAIHQSIRSAPIWLSLDATEIADAPPIPTVDAADDGTAPPAPEPVDPEKVTLDLLEWRRLSSMVAAQAGTRKAQTMLEDGLPVPANRAESEVLHQETEEAYRLEVGLAKTVDLRRFIDIRPLVLHASKGGMLDGESLVGISDSLEAATTLVRTLREASSESADGEDGGEEAAAVSVLPGYFEGIPVQAEIRRTIFDSVDESGKVRDSAEPALSEIRFARREVAKAARQECSRLISLRGDALAARSASVRDDRFVLQVLAKQKHRVPGIVRDVSASGSTLFIEPREIEPVNTKLRQLAKREAALERQVLKKLSALVGAPKVSKEMMLLQERITRVDCAFARARYSHKLDGQPVTFVDATKAEGVNMMRLRHPLLVWPSSSEPVDNTKMVPMDVLVPEGVKAVVITGPNTGGKTVMLKTLGMAALMARSGLRVLCDAGGSPTALVPFFTSVMADIGDDQSIVQSLSTFSAHVARIRRILSHASDSGDSGALVLLDEVGSGTDPTEGSALGMAVLRQLSSDAALTLATTHHGRLKSLKYADRSGCFENACVEFDVASMAPTYRLLWGIPGRSNALAIAERLGLQQGVVEDARAFLAEDGESVSMEEVLSDLQSQREQQRDLNAELMKLKAESSLVNAQLEKRAAAAAAEEAKLRASA